MKILIKSRGELQSAGRWDIDFHLPAEGIKKFPKELLNRVDQVGDVVKDKRDPTKEPDAAFQYIDIAAVDVAIGVITNPQDVEGSEAPSRARKVVCAFDVLISTCRPTRGAIAVVPVKLHNQIASTAFSIVRAHATVNPFYLHYALRLPSTLEQFRKWSTGSSYPAILDSDVKKTVIPVPSSEVQDAIAAQVVGALRERAKVIRAANAVWVKTLDAITASLCGKEPNGTAAVAEDDLDAFSLAEVQAKLKELPPITTNKNANGDEEDDLLLADL
ncbi:MAG: restriction endonuclease subunit S [Methyloceanibacter sp.]